MSVSNIDLYAKYLYADEVVMQQERLPVDAQKRILRLREIYSYWKRYPSMSQSELITWICTTHSLKHSVAYEDLWIVKQLLGAIEKDTKAWHAYNFNKEIMEIYRKAKQAGDYRSAEKALADYAKYNKLDKDEETPEDWWKQIAPQPFTVTSDPRTIGIAPIPNLQEYIKKYNRLYREEAVDADFEEVMAAAKESGEITEAGER